MNPSNNARRARSATRLKTGLACVTMALWGIAGLGQSAGASDDASNLEVEELDFGRPCANPQPAVDLKNPVDRMTRKTPHSDPATPLTQPPYPETARVMAMEGSVVLSLLINEGGLVSRARIKKGARFPILNAAALEGTRDWKLQPGTAQGKPACMWGDFAVQFVLQDYFDAELAKVSVTPEAERLATLVLAAENFEDIMLRGVDLTAQEHAMVEVSKRAFLASGEWLKSRRRAAAILTTEFTPAEIAELLKFQESPVAAKMRALQIKLAPAIAVEANTSAFAFVCAAAQLNFALKGEDAAKVFAGEQMSEAYAQRVAEYAGRATSYCFCRARRESNAARGISVSSTPTCGEAPQYESMTR